MAEYKPFNARAQSESMIFWIIFGLLLLAIGLYILYAKYNPAGNSLLKLIFGR